MLRAHYYQTQIATKLLSSKFVYSSVSNPECVKKLTIESNVKVRNPEVGSATLNVIFGRRPAFTKSIRRQEKEYRLGHLILTSHKSTIAYDLDHLTNALLPFQFENKLYIEKNWTENKIQWTMEDCTPATPLHPIVFPYPIIDDNFNLTAVLIPQKKISTTATIFFLNIFQLPLIAV